MTPTLKAPNVSTVVEHISQYFIFKSPILDTHQNMYATFHKFSHWTHTNNKPKPIYQTKYWITKTSSHWILNQTNQWTECQPTTSTISNKCTTKDIPNKNVTHQPSWSRHHLKTTTNIIELINYHQATIKTMIKFISKYTCDFY